MARKAVIPTDTIKILADEVGIRLADDVATQLALDVEYRLGEITQEAIKFMKHSKRDKLTTDDINSALRLRNIEALYGYNTREPMKFVKAQGYRDIFYTDDPDVDLDTLITSTKLPPCPRQVSYAFHWLAVNGVQPDIPQNPKKKTQTAGQASATTAAVVSTEQQKPEDLVEVKPAVRHVLSKEMQLYFEKVTTAILGDDALPKQAALTSLRSDAGIHQLLPYFCKFISEKVTDNLKNLKLLTSIMKLVEALLINPNISVDHYLHHLIPAVLTCLVGKRLCESPTENHWALRDFCAGLIAYICNRFGRDYATIQPRIVKTLTHAYIDTKRPLTTHYGAIVGLSRISSQTRQLIVLPQLPQYMELLKEALKSENPVKRTEALKCYSALLASAGQFLFDSSKMYGKLDALLVGGPKHQPKEVKIKVEGENSTASTASAEMKGIGTGDLIPLGTHYSVLYDTFGESVFPFLIHRKDDLASSLTV